MLGRIAFRVRSIGVTSNVKTLPLLKSFSTAPAGSKNVPDSKCSAPIPEDDDDEDFEEMFVQGPAGMEWGGPTRGGRRPEPTRYGDWERSGRVSDF